MNALEISARAQSKGGPVVRPTKPRGEDVQLGSSRIVVLIHGYNVDLADAENGYGTFLENSKLGGVSAAGQACAFYWPGDKDWSWFSFLSYPLEMQPAKDSADSLYGFLKTASSPGGWPLEITLICHSLGNRVALELIERFLADATPARLRFRNACFMAAAVSVTMVEDPSSLRAAATLPSLRTFVLYSASDPVLHWAFPPGETSAGEGFFPTAVGRFGQPSGSFWLASVNMAPYGHGDYWPGENSAELVAGFLGLSVPRRPPVSETAGRALAEPREPLRRGLNTRSLETRSMTRR